MPKAVVALCLLLAGCAFPSPGPAPVASRDTLRVVDINVWSGLEYIGTLTMGEYKSPRVREKRYRALVAQLKELDPDMRTKAEALAENSRDLEAAMAEVRRRKQWRRDEAQKTLAYIRKVAGNAPVILMGDFNATEGTISAYNGISTGQSVTNFASEGIENNAMKKGMRY